ncbi:MAG: class I SAM-dependent methyltransferase, partial [Chloroflexi bacterium]|nr:class I SAM-dependent methyltransferase [Chloroflexota bacterium]
HGVTAGKSLEYGSGAAGMSLWFGQQGFLPVALDLSYDALRVAEMNRARRGVSSLNRIVGDASRMPFPDGTFDVVMSYGLLEHFGPSKPEALLREVLRVLRSGGVFVADIVPGRVDVRFAGTIANFLASSAVHAMRGRAHEIPMVRRAYFDHYYESSWPATAWERLLRDLGLLHLQVSVCRPFPPLAITGPLEHAYVEVQRFVWPHWWCFSPESMGARWAWTYLTLGIKP